MQRFLAQGSFLSFKTHKILLQNINKKFAVVFTALVSYHHFCDTLVIFSVIVFLQI